MAKDDVPRGTLLMVATALVFQGPAACPAFETETKTPGIRGTPEQMVKADGADSWDDGHSWSMSIRSFRRDVPLEGENGYPELGKR